MQPQNSHADATAHRAGTSYTRDSAPASAFFPPQLTHPRPSLSPVPFRVLLSSIARVRPSAALPACPVPSSRVTQIRGRNGARMPRRRDAATFTFARPSPRRGGAYVHRLCTIVPFARDSLPSNRVRTRRTGSSLFLRNERDSGCPEFRSKT